MEGDFLGNTFYYSTAALTQGTQLLPISSYPPTGTRFQPTDFGGHKHSIYYKWVGVFLLSGESAVSMSETFYRRCGVPMGHQHFLKLCWGRKETVNMSPFSCPSCAPAFLEKVKESLKKKKKVTFKGYIQVTILHMLAVNVNP